MQKVIKQPRVQGQTVHLRLAVMTYAQVVEQEIITVADSIRSVLEKMVGDAGFEPATPAV
jgi:hypothetical protein